MKFHVVFDENDCTLSLMGERSTEFTKSFGAVTVDGHVVTRLLESFLRDVIRERLDEMKIDDRINKTLDRRLEAACRSVADGVLREAAHKSAVSEVEARARAAAQDLPLEISIG